MMWMTAMADMKVKMMIMDMMIATILQFFLKFWKSGWWNMKISQGAMKEGESHWVQNVSKSHCILNFFQFIVTRPRKSVSWSFCSYRTFNPTLWRKPGIAAWPKRKLATKETKHIQIRMKDNTLVITQFHEPVQCVQSLLSKWKVSSGKRNICSCVIFANIDIANIHIARYLHIGVVILPSCLNYPIQETLWST